MTYHEAPRGWYQFGTHIKDPVPLEFSEETDDAGMPLWERPAQRHDFEASYTGMVCGQMIMRDGDGDQCGLPPDHAIHVLDRHPDLQVPMDEDSTRAATQDEMEKAAHAALHRPNVLADPEAASGIANLMLALLEERRGLYDKLQQVEDLVRPQWRANTPMSLEDYEGTAIAWVAGRNWMIDRIREVLS